MTVGGWALTGKAHIGDDHSPGVLELLCGSGRLGSRDEHCIAISGVGAERAAALRGGRELGGLAVVELGAGIVRAVGERRARAVEGIPRVGTVRAAVARAVLVDFGGTRGPWAVPSGLVPGGT